MERFELFLLATCCLTWNTVEIAAANTTAELIRDLSAKGNELLVKIPKIDSPTSPRQTEQTEKRKGIENAQTLPCNGSDNIVALEALIKAVFDAESYSLKRESSDNLTKILHQLLPLLPSEERLQYFDRIDVAKKQRVVDSARENNIIANLIIQTAQNATNTITPTCPTPTTTPLPLICPIRPPLPSCPPYPVNLESFNTTFFDISLQLKLLQGGGKNIEVVKNHANNITLN